MSQTPDHNPSDDAIDDSVAVPLLSRWVMVRREEVQAVILCTLYHFCIQGGWNILKPIRDEMSIVGGIGNIQWMYTATMVGTLVASVLFGWLASRFSRRVFIPVVYGFIAVTFAVFFLALETQHDEATRAWIGRFFFVWASVFNLFLFALFWGFMADIWSSRQSKRLYGFIGVGGTVGVITGALITSQLATVVGLPWLVVMFVVLIAFAILIVLRLCSLFEISRRVTQEDPSPTQANRRGGADGPSRSALAGVALILRSPYLMGIVLAVIAHTLIGSFLWILRTEIAAREIADASERVAFFANITLYANILTLSIQAFFFGRIARTFGIAIMLALVPTVAIVGFGLLHVLPALGVSALAVVFWVQVLRRGLHYAVTKPAREILYTVLSADEKYKSKSFIDTFVYRGGDAVGSWLKFIVERFGIAIAAVAIPISAVWLVVSIFLGRRQRALAQQQSGASSGATTSQ